MHAAIPPTLARAGTAHAAPTASSAVGKPPTLIASTSFLDTTWSAAGATFGPLVVSPNLRRGDSDFGLVSGWSDAPTGAAGASIARPASLLHVPNRTPTATPLARANAPGSPGASVLDALFALRLPPAPPATPVPVQQQQQQQQQPTNKWLSAALVPPSLERHYSAPPATIPAAAPAPDDDEKAGLATLAALDLLATAGRYPTGGAGGAAYPAGLDHDQRFAASVGPPSASSYTPTPEWRHVQAGAPVTPATPMQITAQPSTNPSVNVAAYAAPALGPADAGGLPYTASTTWGGPYASGYSLGSPAKDNAATVASPPAMPAAAGINQYRPPVADAYAPPPPISQQAPTTTAAQFQQATASTAQYQPASNQYTVNAQYQHYQQQQAPAGGNASDLTVPAAAAATAGHNQFQVPPRAVEYGAQTVNVPLAVYNQYQAQQPGSNVGEYPSPPQAITTTGYNQYQLQQGRIASDYGTTAPTAATGFNPYQSQITSDYSVPPTSTPTAYNQYQSPPTSSAYNQYQTPSTTTSSPMAYNQYQSPPSSTAPSTTYSTTTPAPYYSTTGGYYLDAPPPQTYVPGPPPGVVSAGPTSVLGSPPVNVYALPPPPPLSWINGAAGARSVGTRQGRRARIRRTWTCQVCLFASPKPCANCTSVGLLEPVKYPVVKMSNIPWDVTQRDIQDYFSPTQIPSIGGLPLVHVLMVRESGKTKSDAFVELPTISHLGEVLHERQRRILRGRIVTLTPSSQEELMRAVFPAFPGSWNGVDAVPAAAVEGQAQTHGTTVAAAGPGTHATPAAATAAAANVYRGRLAAAVANDPAKSSSWASWSDASSLGSWTAGETSAGSTAETLATSPPSTMSGVATTAGSAQLAHVQPQQHQQHHHAQQYPPCFLTRNEINQILAVCKNYKLFFSRKCAQRALVSTLQRDHLFEMAKLCIESLHQHLIKPYHQIDPSLMDRLLRAVLMVPAFTEKQKMIVLDASGYACPQAFTHLLTPQGHAAAGAGGPPGSLADVGHGARERVLVDETEVGTELVAAVVGGGGGEAHEHEHDDDTSYLASESPPMAEDLHEQNDHPTPSTKTLTPTLAPAPVPTQPHVNHHQQWASILRNANAAPAASHEHSAADTELRAALARAHGTIARLEGTVLAYELRVKQLERELAAERAEGHHGLAVAAEDHARQVVREPAVQHGHGVVGVGSPTQLVAESVGVAAVGGGEVRPSGVAT
ncbi:hypothetical protein AMAG_15109 [Allomyces macrogynus ATCC 38327]|uniref:RRM domain-containing protein n=1 Tax=Allomyces macrogynus (strain ATCC 38327) TaxID=578462 RepID=A0A0L0T5V7_ALLM3|nr:hypothetical protein AMAG_15109 [Allomyces macrogynus ATCC 38327]|eukprot:KNE70132.1 hypothetical protein AMAG_15109 [Allomyces macrogynus ATCC 38327]